MSLWRGLQAHLDRWEALGADPELVAALQHGVVPEFFHIPEPYDYGELLLEGEQLMIMIMGEIA